MSQQCQHKRIVIQLFRLLILSNSIRKVTLHFIGHAQQPVSKIKALVHLDSLTQLLNGLIVLTRLDVSIPEIRIDDDRERIKLQSLFYLRNGFVESFHLREIRNSIPM